VDRPRSPHKRRAARDAAAPHPHGPAVAWTSPLRARGRPARTSEMKPSTARRLANHQLNDLVEPAAARRSRFASLTALLAAASSGLDLALFSFALILSGVRGRGRGTHALAGSQHRDRPSTGWSARPFGARAGRAT
jgi:hypothetical protein